MPIQRVKTAKVEAGLVSDVPVRRRPHGGIRHFKKPRNGKMIGGATGKGFLPGQVVNRGGRPKGRTLMNVIRDLLKRPNGDESELIRVGQAYIREMRRGSFPHVKEYIDREEGKIPQPLELSASGKPTYKVLKGVSPDEL